MDEILAGLFPHVLGVSHLQFFLVKALRGRVQLTNCVDFPFLFIHDAFIIKEPCQNLAEQREAS